MKDADLLRVGAPAPVLILRAGGSDALALSDLRGEPVVVAFLDQWSAREGSATELEDIRAQLRGLGAVLVILSGDRVWCFRPDDDLELMGERGGAPSWPVAPPALYVIDEQGQLRFGQAQCRPRGDMTATLASALAAAARTVTTARPPGWWQMTRREWVVANLIAGFSLALLHGCAKRPGDGQPESAAAVPAPTGELDVVLNVNGQDRTVRIDPRVSLLDALRERLGLFGTKKGCDHGQCGACTVLVDGRRVLSCLSLAIALPGAKVVTIEGLAAGDVLHPLQAAFIAHDAYQCGYCTPGQIMSAVGLLREGRATTDAEVREQMSGNICRCGAYPNIVAAIQQARKEV